MAHNIHPDSEIPIKRYAIGPVFRKNKAGGQPRSVIECDLDFVYSKTNDMLYEAETLKIAFEILGSVSPLDLDQHLILVNNTLGLSKTLISCNVPNRLFQGVVNILEQLHNPFSTQHVKLMMTAIGVSANSAEKLLDLDSRVLVSACKELNIEKEYVPEIMLLQKHLEGLGLGKSLAFSPLLVNSNVYSGLIFQIIRKTRGRFDVVAAGGRYESLIQTFQSPFLRPNNLNAVGIHICNF